MRKLLIRSCDTLQIIEEGGDTIYRAPLPKWCNDREGIEVICEMGDIPSNADLDKTVIEALRAHIRGKW